MKFTRLHTLCVLLSVAVVAPLAAQTSDDSTSAALVNETPQLWFVQLASPPVVDGTSAAQIAIEQSAFRSAARSAGLKYAERYAYQTLFNGFSVKVAPADIGKLTRIPGVQNIYPVHTVQFGTTDTPDQQDWLAMTGADSAQNDLGVHGDGIRLAIIDTGIDYLHPDLGGCFGPGCRVEMGYDFVGDAYDGSNDPAPDPDPMDCAGHGTHVAGIAGADGHGLAGHVTGVAPHVKFHAYRVFGCNGNTADDNVLAALEKAYIDGTDIISMSLGSAFDDWAESPSAAASTRLVQKGIVVVASAGNSGASGTYSTGSPSTGTKVISVASIENVTVKQPSFTISPDNKPIGYIAATGTSAAPPTSGSSPMKAAPDTNGCGVQPAGTYTGKVALVKRGTCTFNAKAFNAQTAGALAVVLYNNTAGFLNPTVAGPPQITIPVVAITLADGNTIASRLAGGPVTMTWTDQLVTVPNPFAGQVSSFSSYGPSAELDFKPDLAAPGGNIYSTWPYPAPGGYATLSGTSMAAPHVAGSVALLLQAHPHTPPALVRDLLQNNAVPANFSTTAFINNVHVQGAGLIHIDRTILNGVSVSPGKLALGDSAAGPATRTLTFSNSGGSAVTYDLSHVGALTTGPTEFTISEFNAPASASFSAPTVTVPANGSASVDVTISAPTSAGLFTYGGYLVATPEGGGLTLRVPYMGVTDYQAVNVLTTTFAGQPFPLLAHADGTPATAAPVFNLTSGDLPYIFFQLDHPTRTLSSNVFSAPASPGGPLGKSWHLAFKFDYLPRNSTSGAFFAIPFDGTTTNGNKLDTVPPGSYVIVMTALQPLGDPSNPRSVETWQSPAFIITR